MKDKFVTGLDNDYRSNYLCQIYSVNECWDYCGEKFAFTMLAFANKEIPIFYDKPRVDVAGVYYENRLHSMLKRNIIDGRL